VSISLDELQLAARNHGMPLEALRHEITRLGLHYLLTHCDIPVVGAASWRLTVGGRVERPLLSLNDVPLNIRIPPTSERGGDQPRDARCGRRAGALADTTALRRNQPSPAAPHAATHCSLGRLGAVPRLQIVLHFQRPRGMAFTRTRASDTDPTKPRPAGNADTTLTVMAGSAPRATGAHLLASSWAARIPDGEL
jgi:hypothetical protein